MLKKRLFSLIKSGLNSSEILDINLFKSLLDFNWVQIMDLAKDNGLKYLVFEEISKLPEELKPSQNLQIKWHIQTEKSEERFERYLATLERLAALMEENTLPMLLLKGYSIARLYPIPARREGGDIDIYAFDNHSKVDEVLEVNAERVMDFKDDSCHSNFVYEGISVENHKHFFVPDMGFLKNLDVYTITERIILEGISQNRVTELSVGKRKMKILGPELTILHHIVHTLKHAVGEESSLRQYVDWIVLFNHYRNNLDREWLMEKVEEIGISNFIANVELFLEKNLGFEPFFSFKPKRIYKGCYSIEHLASNRNKEIVSRHDNPVYHIYQIVSLFYRRQRLYNIYLGDKGLNTYFLPNFTRKVKRFFGFKNN